jgi:hypothetical protein
MVLPFNKSLFYGDGVLRHADIVTKVFELHRKSHHYSIEKNQPNLLKGIATKINFISRPFVEEAFNFYKDSGKATKKPHPNYFVAICKRLYYEDLDKYQYRAYIKGSQYSKNTNLGKGI